MNGPEISKIHFKNSRTGNVESGILRYSDYVVSKQLFYLLKNLVDQLNLQLILKYIETV